MAPRLATLAASLALGLSLCAPPAHAQYAVIDLKAIAQAEQQVANQLTALQRLESQLTNQALMLQKLPSDASAPVLSIAGQATSILQKAGGLGYTSQSIGTQYASIYPSSLPAGTSLATTQSSLATWRQNNAQALQQAMQVQNQIAQGQATVTGQVSSAVGVSQGAAGQTSAIQATNQLLATVTAQLTQLQTLLITQARATQTIAAQAQASQTTGAADSQRFWTLTAPASRVQNPGQL